MWYSQQLLAWTQGMQINLIALVTQAQNQLAPREIPRHFPMLEPQAPTLILIEHTSLPLNEPATINPKKNWYLVATCNLPHGHNAIRESDSKINHHHCISTRMNRFITCRTICWSPSVPIGWDIHTCCFKVTQTAPHGNQYWKQWEVSVP